MTEVLVPHPAWKPDKTFGPQECLLCMETVPATEPFVCMIDCPCTLVLHTHCGIKYYWSIVPRATSCPVCKATASLLLVHREQVLDPAHPETVVNHVNVECEFAPDAPNFAPSDSDSDEEAAAAGAAADEAEAYQRNEDDADDTCPEEDAEDSDYRIESPLASRYVDAEAGGSSDEDSSEEEAQDDSDEEESAVSTEEEADKDGDDSDESVVVPKKRKRTHH